MPKFNAYNKKSKVIVGWLGFTTTKNAMKNRLKKMKAPKYVIPKLTKRKR